MSDCGYDQPLRDVTLGKGANKQLEGTISVVGGTAHFLVTAR